MGDFFSQSAWRIQVFRNDAIVICHRLIYIQATFREFKNIETSFFFSKKKIHFKHLGSSTCYWLPPFFWLLVWGAIISSRWFCLARLFLSGKNLGENSVAAKRNVLGNFLVKARFTKNTSWKLGSQLPWLPYPYHPCMVYLPTFGCFLRWNMGNVGKYTIHGCYGIIFGQIICDQTFPAE